MESKFIIRNPLATKNFYVSFFRIEDSHEYVYSLTSSVQEALQFSEVKANEALQRLPKHFIKEEIK
jgi:hypothetical protein